MATSQTAMDYSLATPAVPARGQRQWQLEDPLAYLPCSEIVEYQKGRVIYNQQVAPNDLYLVIDGQVKVSRLGNDGRQVVVDIYPPDEFFGESAFVRQPHAAETAVAFEETRVMIWTIAQIEENCIRRPQLAIALLQLMVRRSIEFGHRIESFALDNISRRLARALVRFSDRLSEAGASGSVHTIPFTQEFLAQYVGTSREIVTQHMNQFRRDGLLDYSRRNITVKRDAMLNWLLSGSGSVIHQGFPESGFSAATDRRF